MTGRCPADWLGCSIGLDSVGALWIGVVMTQNHAEEHTLASKWSKEDALYR